MELQSPKPKYYISKYNHSSLELPDFQGIGELEKAIVGYAISSKVRRDELSYEQCASSLSLRELVFEYYKKYSPHIIGHFISETIKVLEQSLGSLIRERRTEVEGLVRYFRELEERPIKSIKYQDFETDLIKKYFAYQGASLPFRKYVVNTITNLLLLGILKRHTSISMRMYVTFNPQTKFKWPNKKRI